MINKIKLLIHDIYWASQLPFLKKKYTFDFDEEAFEVDYNSKQTKLIEEITKILSPFDLNTQKKEEIFLLTEKYKQEIFNFFKKNNIQLYKINFNPIVQSNLHLYQGFIPKNEGLWSFILNIILLLNGNKVKLNFENADMILYDNTLEYHILIYKLYSYLQYKHKYPFVEEKKNAKKLKLLAKTSNKLMKNLNMKEMKILEKLIIYEKEAFGFAIGILRQNANIYEELNQNDK